MDELEGAIAAHWVDGCPVFNVVDWLRYWHRQRRLSLCAAGELILAGLAADPGAAMLLRPGRAPCWVPDGVGARRAAPPQRLIKRSSGLVPLPACAVGAAAAPHQLTGAAHALQLLRHQWARELRHGRVSPVVPGLGCGLGVTEESARRLWPALFGASGQSTTGVNGKRPRPGTRTAGLPDDEALARELADEKARRAHGATARLAEKYGCSVDTIGRRAKAGAASRRASFFPRLAGSGR